MEETDKCFSSNMIGFEIIQTTLGLKNMFIYDNNDKLK